MAVTENLLPPIGLFGIAMRGWLSLPSAQPNKGVPHPSRLLRRVGRGAPHIRILRESVGVTGGTGYCRDLFAMQFSGRLRSGDGRGEPR
jgi:hypothetical protein